MSMSLATKLMLGVALNATQARELHVNAILMTFGSLLIFNSSIRRRAPGWAGQCTRWQRFQFICIAERWMY